MGVPKFARFICERYPCILEILNEYQIPEFDNLYLDMNGIIHNCSHPNSADAHFRITEETIFKNIFHYVEELFRIIKPQKLFFMAVDGVAPRAKINQQRGRRFRAAKEAELAEAKARAKGETIPSESRFDSNCITPGTLFMSRLTEQLKYFVQYKISTDRLWQKCKVILSGPEVPGEGEHKIMDYIRYMKSQPDHDPNSRHCLYGLDADLIMLSICTHEPHFTVLREEVKYGKNLKVVSPEKVRFCLLHISLLREYIEHEFESVKDKLSFEFNIEKVLDDWILMGFLIGNDFIPHLPHLHIANGSLQALHQAYIEFLPTIDGYINEGGKLHLDRFEKFMEKLSHLEVERFSEHLADLKYLEGKMGRKLNDNTDDFDVNNPGNEFFSDVNLKPQKTNNKELNNLIQMTDDLLIGHSDEEELLDTDSDNETYNLEFLQHKRDYYKNKFDYENIDEDFMRSQAEAYITAIQWNLNYYYSGCCSWSWYYPHHYAPYISDVKGFKDLKFNFNLDKPFLPFQQLLAVLPAASKELLPEAYQGLLTEEASPIIDYYPEEFRTDLNEKKQEWEAVVLIPFVNEKKLIDAMEPFNHLLTEEEKKRNQHGPMCIITYSAQKLGIVNAPNYFASVDSYAEIILLDPKEIEVPEDKLVIGLCNGVKLNVYYSGFPTFQYINYTFKIMKGKIKVFEQLSRNDNMILTIVPKELPSFHDLAREILGKIVFIRWPHLEEALVVGISNKDSKFSLMHPNLGYSLDNLNREYLKGTGLQSNPSSSHYYNRFGIDIGDTQILVYVLTIDGRRYEFTNQGRLTLEKEWSHEPIPFPYQMIVRDIESQQNSYLTQRNISDIYTHKSVCFMLGHPHYGAMGEVLESGYNAKTGRIKVAMRVGPEPNVEQLKMDQRGANTSYMNGNLASQKLGISKYLLIRITGSVYVFPRENNLDKKQFNIGLNLKFTKKNEELPGYTRKINGQWLYSLKSIELIRQYMNKFPTIFEFLNTNESEPYSEQSLFPNNPEKVGELLSWLQDLPTRSVDSRNSDWESLDSTVLSKLEKITEKYVEDEEKIMKTISMQVKPHLLFKPGLTMGIIPPDPKAQHFIFDRIVSIREESCVPLGYKGTIVGIKVTDNSETLYDIYFDKGFVANISFSGDLTTHRYKFLTGEFINISHGIRAEQSLSEIFSVPEKTNSRKKSTKPGFEVSNQNKPSAFASFSKVDNFLPGFCKSQQQHQQPPQKIQLLKKNQPDNKGTNSPIINNTHSVAPKIHDNSKMNKLSPQIQDKSQSVPVNSSINLVTNNPQVNSTIKTNQQNDFQMLWNELQKTSIKTGPPSAMMFPLAPQMPITNPHGPSHPPVVDTPQDPSAFLKAVLGISGDNTNSSSSSNNMGKMNAPPPPQPAKPFIFPSAPPVPQSTPPLVQQLFDHARQKNQKEGGQYYTYLMNHCKIFGMLPPKFVCHSENNLIRAQVILPDLRSYQGNLCLTQEQAVEDVCMRVMKELTGDRTPPPPPPPPQVQQQLPQVPPPFFASNAWVNMPPPPNPFPMQSLILPNTYPEAQKPSVRPPPSWNPQHHNIQQHQNPQNQNLAQKILPSSSNTNNPVNSPAKEKTEVKKNTPFVPLQAQKKHRSRKPKESSPSDADEKTGGIKQQQRKELLTDSPKKNKPDKSVKNNETKQINQSAKENPQPIQKVQKAPGQRKSRIAAKFGPLIIANCDKEQ